MTLGTLELCKEISVNQIYTEQVHLFFRYSAERESFYLADEKGNPAIKKRAEDFISFPIGQMKPLYRKSVRYHNIGRCYLPRYRWVYATVVYDTKRNAEAFLLVTNNQQANGPWIIKSYYKRWGIETLIRDAKQSLGLPNFHMFQWNNSSSLCLYSQLSCSFLASILSWSKANHWAAGSHSFSRVDTQSSRGSASLLTFTGCEVHKLASYLCLVSFAKPL